MTFAIILLIVSVIATIIGYWPRNDAGATSDFAASAVNRRANPSLLDNLDPRAKQAIQAGTTGESYTLAIKGAQGSAIVGTDRRVIVYKRGVTAGATFGQKFNSYSYRDITGVEVSETLTTLGSFSTSLERFP